MENVTPANRTILLFVTNDDGVLLATPADGSPRVLTRETAFDKLAAMAKDPTIPAAKMERSGFDFKDAMRGLGQWLEGMGRGEGGGG